MRKAPLTWPRPDQPSLNLTEEQLDAERLKFIPDISKEAVTVLLERVTPLVRNNVGHLCIYSPAEPCDPFQTSFTWDRAAACGDLADVAKLRLLEAVPTYHTCGYHACFKPSIAEVLAQLPVHLQETVTAFEVLFGQDLTECVDYPGLYGHKTVTLFYGDTL